MIMPSGMEDRVVKVENNTRNKDATPFDQTKRDGLQRQVHHKTHMCLIWGVMNLTPKHLHQVAYQIQTKPSARLATRMGASVILFKDTSGFWPSRCARQIADLEANFLRHTVSS
jgi:hypothetical protein